MEFQIVTQKKDKFAVHKMVHFALLLTIKPVIKIKECYAIILKILQVAKLSTQMYNSA